MVVGEKQVADTAAQGVEHATESHTDAHDDSDKTGATELIREVAIEEGVEQEEGMEIVRAALEDWEAVPREQELAVENHHDTHCDPNKTGVVESIQEVAIEEQQEDDGMDAIRAALEDTEAVPQEQIERDLAKPGFMEWE